MSGVMVSEMEREIQKKKQNEKQKEKQNESQKRNRERKQERPEELETRQMVKIGLEEREWSFNYWGAMAMAILSAGLFIVKKLVIGF